MVNDDDPQQSNRFPIDKIKSRPIFFPVRAAALLSKNNRSFMTTLNGEEMETPILQSKLYWSQYELKHFSFNSFKIYIY